MIDALVAYFQNKGFTVDVYLDHLSISKIAKDQTLTYDWFIVEEEMKPRYEHLYFLHADNVIHQLMEEEANL